MIVDSSALLAILYDEPEGDSFTQQLLDHGGASRQRACSRSPSSWMAAGTRDCFAYALAKVTGERLLYKGDDFVHTDITSAAD